MRQDSLKTLSQIAHILQKASPFDNPLAHIVKVVREQMSVDVCSLYILRDKYLLLIASEGLDQAAIGKVKMKIDEGLTGLAVETLDTVIVNEASLHPRFKYFPQTGEEKFHSFAAIPLLDREKVVGVLSIQTIEQRDFSAPEIDLLKLITFQLASVIQNLLNLEVFKLEPNNPEKVLKHFKGIGVASGFGIGPAFYLRPGAAPVIISPQNLNTTHPDIEWKKISVAITKASEELLQLEKKLQKKLTKHESDIFYSHRMILSDPVFLKKIKQAIYKGHSSLSAVTLITAEYIEEFEKIENPLFRERIADLEDLRERMLAHLLGNQNKKKQELLQGILVADNLSPSDTAKLDPERISGIVTSKGGLTSHAAILASSLGIPAVMGVTGIHNQIQPGDLLIVDGTQGEIHVNPDSTLLQKYENEQKNYADRIVHLQSIASQTALTKDEKRVHLLANIGFISDIKKLHYYGAEGIGLYRTEMPFMKSKHLPTEDEQFDYYVEILKEAKGLPVTFRILDAGGDKPIESLGIQNEENPFLGYRSLRFSLSKPEILEVQFRALLRASMFGNIQIMIPMVSGLEDIWSVKKVYQRTQEALKKIGIPFQSQIPFGIMVEMPSAVQLIDVLAQESDFLSVGTNDLIQYTLAVDRNNERVSSFFEPLHPAVIRSLSQIFQAGKKAKKPVTVCGEMAGDPLIACLLLGMGLDQLSMIPASIPFVKQVLLHLDYSYLQQVASEVIICTNLSEVKKRLRPLEEKIGEVSSHWM